MVEKETKYLEIRIFSRVSCEREILQKSWTKREDYTNFSQKNNEVKKEYVIQYIDLRDVKTGNVIRHLTSSCTFHTEQLETMSLRMTYRPRIIYKYVSYFSLSTDYRFYGRYSTTVSS